MRLFVGNLDETLRLSCSRCKISAQSKDIVVVSRLDFNFLDTCSSSLHQIGGSLAGLFTSIPLVRLGHRVTILERSPTPLLHDQGAGVVAGGDTQAFFARHDLFKRGIAVASKARLYLDKEGNVVDEEGYQQRMTSWDLLYYVARANFDGVRSEYLSDGEWEGVTEELKSGWERAKYEYGREVKGSERAGREGAD